MKGVNFSGPMVRAILLGTKTQTRRPVKHDPLLGSAQDWCNDYAEFSHLLGPLGKLNKLGKIGTKLYVKETWKYGDSNKPIYAADYSHDKYEEMKPWKFNQRMPKEVSRITIEIVDIRIQKIHDISPVDVEAEGVKGGCVGDFAILWDSIYRPKKKFYWSLNPWVWVFDFKVVKR